jgi:hypothetical protein
VGSVISLSTVVIAPGLRHPMSPAAAAVAGTARPRCGLVTGLP